MVVRMATKKGSTLFLRGVIMLIGLAVLALCVFVLPVGIRSDQTGGYRPILIGMYLPAVPFFVALVQGWKLLGYIDRNRAFSALSVQALRVVKYCGVVIGSMYAVGMPYIFMMADMDDAPGVALVGFLFTFAPLAAAVLAANLQKLMENAINLKTENDLTV